MTKARAKAKHGPAKATYQAEREERERARGDRPHKAMPAGSMAAPAIGEVSLGGRVHEAVEERRTAVRPSSGPRPPATPAIPESLSMPAADFDGTASSPPADPAPSPSAAPPSAASAAPPSATRARRTSAPAPEPAAEEPAEQPVQRRRRERVTIAEWEEPAAPPDERIRTAAGRYLIDVAHDETPRRLGEFPLRIDDTVRRTWRHGFDLVVRRRFEHTSPLAEITRTVKTAVQDHAFAGLPPLDAEMLVRAALGERVPVEGITDEVVVGSQLLVFASIADELALSDDELDVIVAEAERRAASGGVGRAVPV